MKTWSATSLRGRLTWRMVLMQAGVLLAFGIVAMIPIVRLMSAEQGLDDAIVQDISASIERGPSGALNLIPNAALAAAEARFSDFWFYAADVDGVSVQMGGVPDHIGSILEGLTRLDSSSVATIDTIGTAAVPTAIVRRQDDDAGPLWIITAGGPKLGSKLMLAAFASPIFLGLLALLALASFLFIPLIVARQLRGVNHVAAEADTIDVDQRGIRLSSEHVPDELHPLVGAVNAALQRIDDGMERRQRFLADAAHELRTPIAILQTRIELLPDDAQRSRLMLDVARLANLANQLLDLQRLDADRSNFQPINLVELAAQVTADMAPLAIAAGDEISFDSEVKTVTVAADRASLSRALVNLIQNAVIHGGSKTAIHVAVGRDGSLRVSDTGPGVAEQHRETIFEPFSRIVPLDQGGGLGLNLVKDIVDRHNGRVTVGDAAGGGALFEIRLPLT